MCGQILVICIILALDTHRHLQIERGVQTGHPDVAKIGLALVLRLFFMGLGAAAGWIQYVPHDACVLDLTLAKSGTRAFIRNYRTDIL